MARHSPEGYMFGGAGMMIVGAFFFVRGLRKPSPNELISATVTDTRSHEGGDYKVTVEWRDKQGEAKRSHVIVSSGDLSTRGSTIQVVPSRFRRGGVQIPKLSYRIGPAIWSMVFGAAWFAMGYWGGSD